MVKSMRATRWKGMKRAAATLVLLTTLVFSAYKPSTDTLPTLGIKPASAEHKSKLGKRKLKCYGLYARFKINYLEICLMSHKERRRVVPELIGNLEKGNEEVKWALVEIGKPAVPSLIKSLNHKDAIVREVSAWTLGMIADRFGKIKNRQAVSALIQRINDKSIRVRKMAALALGETKDKRAIPALIKAVEDEDENTGTWSAWALGQIGKPAIPTLFAALKHSKPRIRGNAAYALGWIRTNASVLPALIGKLNDPNAYVRMMSARALGTLGNKRAVPALIKKLNDESEKVRLWTVRALGDLGGRRAVRVLMKKLDDQNPEVVDSAVDSIGEIAEKMLTKRRWKSARFEGIAFALTEALKKEKDAYPHKITDAILKFVGANMTARYLPKMLPSLFEIMYKGDSQERNKATELLVVIGKRNKSMATGIVLQLVEKLEQWRYIHHLSLVAETLGKMGDKTAVPALEKFKERYVTPELKKAAEKAIQLIQSQPASVR